MAKKKTSSGNGMRRLHKLLCPLTIQETASKGRTINGVGERQGVNGRAKVGGKM